MNFGLNPRIAPGKFLAAQRLAPGTYTLRAYADGILGDFAKAKNVKVEAGRQAPGFWALSR